MKLITQFWIDFDRVDSKTRFLWFVAYIAIPYSILVAWNYLFGFLFAGLMILWREVSVRRNRQK